MLFGAKYGLAGGKHFAYCAGVGRTRGPGRGLGVTLGIGVGEAVGVGVGVAPDCAQYIPPAFE
jgi:hypothetical protein